MKEIVLKGLFIIVLGVIPHYTLSQDKKMLKSASRGNVEAQVLLGNYYLGRGLSGDEELAVVWYVKAAEKGNDKAQYLLDYCYENGYGVNKDLVMARHWYEKAAERNNIEAEKALFGLRNKTSAPVMENDNKDKDNKQPLIEPKQAINHMSDVDVDIPSLGSTNKTTFAIVIANEDYQRESKVDFAKNDGKTFQKYCHQVLGLPEKNIHLVENGTLNNMIYELDWLELVCKAYDGEASVIFYYAGHGVPDEANGKAYLLPIDGTGKNLRTCLSTEELYKTLGGLLASSVTVLMDACFSGTKRSGEMLASARGVAIQAKASAPKGNMVVLSAAQGDETAYSYKDTQHGLFTYFLLKKLKESKGATTLGELAEYVETQVKRFSIVENGKSQTPTVNASSALGDNWRKISLK